ncbi:hypothetical protein QYF61_012285 [Mycteria americana]|uniref:Uncharacterized protein n=1 Tax=Mycteria americana TaxID=33587 RepID=A0AAN7NAT0_MYCAM|nr:hypothetical protein QYF61_012285 [Mycteria americana]
MRSACVSERERYTLKAGDQSYLKYRICYSSRTDDSESRLAVTGRAQILAIPSGAAWGSDVTGRSPQPYRGTAQPPATSRPPPARGGQLSPAPLSTGIPSHPTAVEGCSQTTWLAESAAL